MKWRVLIAATMTTACTSHDDVPADVPPDPDPTVYVEDHLTSSWPTTIAPVTFLAPDGSTIQATELPPGGVMFSAPMPEGGSVVVFRDLSSSPTSQVHETFSVDGVEPGDRYVFGGTPPSLPSDCVIRGITTWTVDPATSRAVWIDPDAASVDARIIQRNSASCVWTGMPPYRCDHALEIDGSDAVSVEANDLRAITVVACPNATYRAIRTAVAGAATLQY